MYLKVSTFGFWQKDIENITYKCGIYFIDSENS